MTGPPDYVLGASTAEHDRLIRQARSLAPCTLALFRDAGLAPGMRVLDVGCGVGDVSFAAAELVGTRGEVVGIDRDAGALATAAHRAGELGLRQVQFVASDAVTMLGPPAFDAVVGRFVLMFQPDPAALLATLVRRLRPGGIVIFQEASWATFFAHTRGLPLRAACGELACEALRRGGAIPDMTGLLYRAYPACGLEEVRLRVDLAVAYDDAGRRWLVELLATLWPRLATFGIAIPDVVGDPDTLAARLDAELEVSGGYSPFVGLVGAWGRVPGR